MTRKTLSIALCIAIVTVLVLPATAFAARGAGKKPIGGKSTVAHGKKAGVSVAASKGLAKKTLKPQKVEKAARRKATKPVKAKAQKAAKVEKDAWPPRSPER